MASESAHAATANRNQETINCLCADFDKHAPWVVTIACYKALHIIEAAFFNDPDIAHTGDHPGRFQRLKTRRYKHIFDHYGPLFRASLLARYLEDDRGTEISSFDEYITADKVQTIFLFHHLKQIENSAQRRLACPEALLSVDSAKPILQRTSGAKRAE